jgi:hypothetical protein
MAPIHMLSLGLASLIEGPLASTSAHLTKVATSPRNEQPNHQHVLCLYVPDVYDKSDVTEVGGYHWHDCMSLSLDSEVANVSCLGRL